MGAFDKAQLLLLQAERYYWARENAVPTLYLLKLVIEDLDVYARRQQSDSVTT